MDMHTYRFKINETRIELCDVGGQRSELVGSLTVFPIDNLCNTTIPLQVKMLDYLRHWSFNANNDQEFNFILLVVSMSDYNVRHERYEGTLLDECVRTHCIISPPSGLTACSSGGVHEGVDEQPDSAELRPAHLLQQEGPIQGEVKGPLHNYYSLTEWVHVI